MSSALPQPDATQLAAWHKKYGQVFTLAVAGHTAYLRAPKRRQFGDAVARHKQDAVRLLVYLLHTGWLGGDLVLKVKEDGQENDLFKAVLERMGELLPELARAAGYAV